MTDRRRDVVDLSEFRRRRTEHLAGGMTSAEALTGAARLGRLLRPSGQRVSISLTLAGFQQAVRLAADGFERLARRAAIVGSGLLLQRRLAVDVDAHLSSSGEWISPVCRGWLCLSCPGMSCHHRCHPGGHIR